MKNPLRRLIRTLMITALRLRSRPYTPQTDGRCVIIAPHPDDETFGCAGLIHAHRTSGRLVSVICITDGAGSHPDHPRLSPSDVAMLRQEEIKKAMACLGVEHECLAFLNASDGALAHLHPSEFEALTRQLSGVLAFFQPTELLLPCRDDGSSEHTASFTLCIGALKLAGLTPRILEYPVWARWSPLRIMGPWIGSSRVLRICFPDAIALKRTAIAAYITQTEPTPPWTRPVLPEGFAACFDSAEEFFFERDVVF